MKSHKGTQRARRLAHAAGLFRAFDKRLPEHIEAIRAADSQHALAKAMRPLTEVANALDRAGCDIEDGPRRFLRSKGVLR